MNHPTHIIVHHTATSFGKNPAQFKATNTYHKGLGFPISSMGYYVGYHYMIEKDGTLIQARKDMDNGAHTSQQNMNFTSIGVCLTGDFDHELPTDAQYKTLYDFLKKKQAEYKIPDSKILPHRIFATYKSCWGSLLPDNIMEFVKGKVEESKPEPSDMPSIWAIETMKAAKDKGIMSNWSTCKHTITPKKIAYVFYNLGWLDVHPDDEKSPYKNRDMNEEEFMVALHKGKVF